MMYKMKKIIFFSLLSLQVLPSFTQIKVNKATSLTPSLYKRVKEGVNAMKFETPSGPVIQKFITGQQAVNNIVKTTVPLNTDMCLTREEVKGQKIESEHIIADGGKALQLLPGSVIDGNKLLQTGEFIYVNMNKRKPVTLSTTSNLAKVTTATINPLPDENIEAKIRSSTQSLTRASNLNGMPNVSSDGKVKYSTSSENTGLEIGASFFYMGVSAADNFSFSSEKYRYMYLFEFTQECLPVMANAVSSPADIFTGQDKVQDSWFYVREVKYGRRLYILIESQTDLEKFSNEFSGGLNWLAVSAAYSQKNTGQSYFSSTNIRIITQGGSPVALPDVAKLQSTIDNYFKTPFRDMEIVPLSYKLTSLTGSPVSMETRAFLNDQYCLDKNKVRVRVKNISCERADDGSDKTEQVYGNVGVYLFNKSMKQVAADGKTIIPDAGVLIPTGLIIYAKEMAPLVLRQGDKPKEFNTTQQDKYVDLSISSLDMTIEVRPVMKEKDDFSDDVFVTDNKLKKTLRKILMEGSTITVFEFRDGNSIIKLTIEISPVY